MEINPVLRIYGTTVPSEVLEGPLTKIMAVLFQDYAKDGCTDEGFKVLLGQAKAFGMLISELGSTHCSLAFTREVRSMLWKAEKDAKFRKSINRDFIRVYKKQMGIKS